MWLAVDCGNSRIKWATVQNGRPSAVQSAEITPHRESATAELAKFAELSGFAELAELRRAAENVSHARVSHVGAALSRENLCRTLRPCPKVEFVKSRTRGGGIVSRYLPPLGVDRWLALIAVRPLRRDVAMICAGTAATIDFLRRDGVFVGGAILPGVDLSIKMLAFRAGLQTTRQNAQITLPPKNTNDATTTGAISAIVGAALFLRRRILPGARFIVGGGNAESLLPWLPKTTKHLPYPTIDGLVRLHEMRR